MDDEERKEATESEKKRAESRQKWHDFSSKDMYAIAMAYLEEHLERVQTEGMGDCWLLSIMAGFEGWNNRGGIRLTARCKSRRPSEARRTSSDAPRKHVDYNALAAAPRLWPAGVQ